MEDTEVVGGAVVASPDSKTFAGPPTTGYAFVHNEQAMCVVVGTEDVAIAERIAKDLLEKAYALRDREVEVDLVHDSGSIIRLRANEEGISAISWAV